MNNFINCIKSDLYKIFHSKLFWLHLIVPFLGIIIFAGYYSYAPINEKDKIFLYVQAVVLAFPLMIAIVTLMLEEQEANAGNFCSILSAPCSKIIAHSSKLIVITAFGFFACLFTVLGFGIVFHLMGYYSYPITLYLKLSFVIFASNFGLYIVQYIISFDFGKGISLGTGILGTLLSPLLYFGLVDSFWYYIPFSWGIRMSTYYFYKAVNSEKFIAVINDYMKGSFVITAIIIILIPMFLLWSNIWQGQKCKSE